jgi:outer membrane receptor protein involved in Fe transport
MRNFSRTPWLFLIVSLIFYQFASAQQITVIVSGQLKDVKVGTTIPYGSIQLKRKSDLKFASGTVSDEQGRFILKDVSSGEYFIEVSVIGYQPMRKAVSLGKLSQYLDLGIFELSEDNQTLQTVEIKGSTNGLSEKMDKRSYNIEKNTSQLGGSVLQAMQNLPGVTIQDGKVQLRGNDKVAVLIDGKQNAITGFGSQAGLDNLPASAIDRIEIIANPSSKFDANGNAGIINIIYKKNKQEGFNGKIGMSSGLGALWIRKENFPGIHPQYQNTPKINPTISLNYRKNKVNTFLQADYLYTKTLNRNEFSQRIFDDGTILNQQVKRNRNTSFSTVKTGLDFNLNDHNSFTVAAYLSREKILDRGDIPYFNNDFSVRNRLWQFLEDEVKYTATGSAVYLHNFSQPGHTLTAGLNYTWHREDEKYNFSNILPDYTGEDAFKLLSDEHVSDLTLDYIKPMKHGRLEAGVKYRHRSIPTNMRFFPGLNSPIDVNAGGQADYRENIPAVYGNYIYETTQIEVEAGLRVEYANIDYLVNPNHNTYKTDGYDYLRPFPNVRFAYKVNANNRITLFYNARVDRPNEVDIRIFPKYDEPELLKVGNPGLRPQYTNALELGYKYNWANGSLYGTGFHKMITGTITRIATQVPGNNILYNIFQNAGKSHQSGAELLWQQQAESWFSFNLSGTVYNNTIKAFSVENNYPVPTVFSMDTQSMVSGNVKLNTNFRLKKDIDVQFSSTYLAPDLIPQGKIGSRYSADLGLKKLIQKGQGELFLNGNDIFNTLTIKKEIFGNGFKLHSTDYYETQVFRVGYNYKF